MKAYGEFKIVTLRETPPTLTADKPEDVLQYFKQCVEPAPWFDALKECVVTLMLNVRMRVTGHNLVSIGGLDSTLIHPREVFRPAIVSGAHSIVLIHNHPSGDPTPSEADLRVTRDLMHAGKMLRIELMDHVIIGNDCASGYSSLRELGMFYA